MLAIKRHLTLLGLGLALVGCTGGSQPGKSGASPKPGGGGPAAPPPPEVQVLKISPRELSPTSEYAAQTSARRTVEVKSQVEGILEDFSFAEGSYVSKGQVLFSVDPRTYAAAVRTAEAQIQRVQADLNYARRQVNLRKAQADLAQAQANLVKATQDVDRYRPLADRQVIPRQTYDVALAAQRVAQAQVDAGRANVENTRLSDAAQIEVQVAQLRAGEAALTNAQITLGRTVIRSPIDGIIGRLDVNPGNFVKVGDAVLATIIETNPIYVDFSVSEVENLEFRKRASHAISYQLVLADGSVYPRPGRLSLTSPSLDQRTGTLPIRLEFDNPGAALRPGQFGRIRVRSQHPVRTLVVPQRALVEMQSLQAVYVLKPDSTVEQRPVELGDPYETDFPVRSGLKAGELVVVEGVQKLKPGMKVTVTEDKPASPGAAAK